MTAVLAQTTGRVLHGVLLIDEQLDPRPRKSNLDAIDYDRTLTVRSLEVRPIGHQRLELEFAATPDYSIGTQANTPDVVCFRYFDFCEVQLERETGIADIALHPDVNPGVAAMWFENSVVGTWLALEGNPVLHASCVAIDQTACLIAGPSGSGKTTLAAACCAAGATLLSDDAVRLQQSGTAWSAFPGSPELRLRKNAERLLDNQTYERRSLPDDRLGISPLTSHRVLPIQAIWLPTTGAAPSARVVPLFGHAALAALLSAQRCDWTPRYAAAVLRWSRELAQAIPVYRLELPEGGLADESLVHSLVPLLLPQVGVR